MLFGKQGLYWGIKPKDQKTAEFLDRVRGMGTFMVSFLERGGLPEEKVFHPIPLHDHVLRPLLAMARECRVYGLDYDEEIEKLMRPVTIKMGKTWRLDLTKEVIRGYEKFWNNGCVHNGLAVIANFVEIEDFDLFRFSGRPQAWASMHQVAQGTSKAAVTFCRQEVASDPDTVAFLFSGSNGLEWADIFAQEEKLFGLLKLAFRDGKKENINSNA